MPFLAIIAQNYGFFTTTVKSYCKVTTQAFEAAVSTQRVGVRKEFLGNFSWIAGNVIDN